VEIEQLAALQLHTLRLLRLQYLCSGLLSCSRLPPPKCLTIVIDEYKNGDGDGDGESRWSCEAARDVTGRDLALPRRAFACHIPELGT